MATLDSPDPVLAASTATALGLIGDPEPIPFLTYPAVAQTSPPQLQKAARTAIESLAHEPATGDVQRAVRVLTAAAWRYHRQHTDLTGDPVLIWAWDKTHNLPVSREATPTEANVTIGLQLAHEALQLAPNDLAAQVIEHSIALERAVERVGVAAVATQDDVTFTAAKRSGPLILGEVLKAAIGDGKAKLAAAARRCSASRWITSGFPLFQIGRGAINTMPTY